MQPSRNIVWIASYHKSGNTWTRVFLANFLAPKGARVSINGLDQFTTSDSRQDWYDKANGGPFKGDTIDDSLLLRRKVHHLISASAPGTRLVKTHSQVDQIGPVHLISPEVTAAAIYVMRNPFDVAPSLARHAGASLDETVERMTNAKNLVASDTNIVEVLGRWDDHIAGWLNAPGLPRHVMRYEDMLSDPERAFRALLQFLQLPPNDGQLRRAIRASSFKALQQQEQREGFKERPAVLSQFFRSGKAGGWRDELTPDHVRQLREAFMPTLERYYPEMLAETEAFAA